jgi:hypothetical protein
MRIRRSAIGLFLCAILGANIQFTNANAATFASGTPCEVIVSDISNLTYSHNSSTRECTYTFSYNATVRTVTLPKNLASATLTLTGARGGQGGPRDDGPTTTSSSTSSYVGVFSGTIPSSSSKQIEIHTGGIGVNGTNPNRNGTFHSGPAGGSTSYGSGGNGGSGGGQRGSMDAGNSMFPGGTGGGGGGATVAVINSTPIFAGGGGGTGGTGRKDFNVNWAGAAAASGSTSQASQLNGVKGEDNPSTNTDNSCSSNGGAGGGGGGGYQGGNGGIYGAPRCNAPKAFVQSTGGYPGSNGTSYSLTSTSSSYVSRSTATTDSTAYGSVVIVLVYKGTATATLSLPAGNLVYRQAKVISVTSSVAGKITFTIGGKVLPGCKNKAATLANSYTVTCSLRPSTRNSMTIAATLNPSDPEITGTVVKSAQFLVANRTGPRVP